MRTKVEKLRVLMKDNSITQPITPHRAPSTTKPIPCMDSDKMDEGRQR